MWISFDLFLHALVGQKDCYIRRPPQSWNCMVFEVDPLSCHSSTFQREAKSLKYPWRYSCNGIVLHAVERFCRGRTMGRPLDSWDLLWSRCIQAANSVSNFLAGEKQLSSEFQLKGPILTKMDRGDTVVIQRLHSLTSSYQLPHFWE